MLGLPSLDPTATASVATDPTTAGGSRRRGAGSVGGSLAAALAAAGGGARRALPIAGDDLLPLEEMDANPGDELLALCAARTCRCKPRAARSQTAPRQLAHAAAQRQHARGPEGIYRCACPSAPLRRPSATLRRCPPPRRQQADEVFDAPPDLEVDLFGGELDGLLPPPELDYGGELRRAGTARARA